MVEDSTTKVEYIAPCEAAKEVVVRMKKFISELGVVALLKDYVHLSCDNNGVTGQAKEPRSHQKSKHFLQKYHLIKEIIECAVVKIEKVDGKENATYPFTKALDVNVFDKNKRGI